MVSGTISPPYSGYFSPFPHGTCSLSVSQEYLALPDGAGKFRQSFTGSALLRIPTTQVRLRLRDYHPLRFSFPEVFYFAYLCLCRSYYPEAALTASVWAIPRSLATTRRITIVFSSSGYLDVSVRRVRPPCGVPGLQPGGFPHSEIYGYKGYLHLPVAYRSLSRPSSPLRA